MDWRFRAPLMALAMLSLLLAVWAGLIRLGWQLPPLRPSLPIAHGPLMVSGFLGTLISLERAVALNRRWAYTTPALTGVGSLLLLLARWGNPAGPWLITLGSLGMVALFILILRRQTALFTVVMALGALAWLAGNALWLAGRPFYQLAPWWAGFLVLTIAGERLELNRVLRLSPHSRTLFLAAVSLFLAGLALTLVTFDAGVRLAGVGLLVLAAWLLRYDIARRTIKMTGLTRFMAACLLSGYVWLGAAGIMWLAFGGVVAGLRYDAMLHALFLGFVFAMIFGHAPVIFPAVLGLPIVYRPAFYLHLAFLHATLLLRVIGDLAGWLPGRQWGGMLNAVVLLLFLVNTAASVQRKGTSNERP